MVLWWIGNLVLLLVIAPAVIFLLHGVLDAALTVRRALNDVRQVGGRMVADLEPIPELVTTMDYASQTADGLTRYGAALDKIL